MATYTSRLSAQARAQHVPLGQALREYAGSANRDKLLSLLLPVQRAARTLRLAEADGRCRGDLPSPALGARPTRRACCTACPTLERAGVVVRMPATWRASRPARPQVTATVGSRAPSAVGLDGLLDFRMDVMLDGEPLTEAEVAALLAGTEDLVLLRGQWVEVDRERMGRTMEQFQAAEALAARDGLSFAEAMRLLAGAAVTATTRPRPTRIGRASIAGPWLEQTLRALRAPDGDGRRSRSGAARDAAPLPEGRRRNGCTCWRGSASAPAWPTTWASARRSRCCRCCWWKRPVPQRCRPSLLVAPASLLGNWAAEIEKFAPSLKAVIVHPSAMPADQVKALHRPTGGGARSGDHQLWLAAAHPGARRDRLAVRHPGRGAGDQESERPPDQGGKGAEGQGAHRADRHAGREPPGRPVVDLRFLESGPAGQRQAVRALCQGPGRADAQSLRSAARAGAALHPAPDEDRQVDHRRSARQDGDQGAVRAVAAGRRRLYGQAVEDLAEEPRRTPTASSARASCWRC